MTESPSNPSSQHDAASLAVAWSRAFQDERDHLELAAESQPTALCLSGGGVRSAALCLGAMRSLADRDHGLLHQFHYLSTVSGGGYIGSWLTRFVADQPEPDRVIATIAGTIGRRASEGEAPPVKRLRRYTRFLAPQAGLLSLDTLAGILLWMRNTLVNWLVFLPIFGALAALPLLYFALAAAAVGGPVGFWAILIAAPALIWGSAASVLYLPSHYHPDPETRAVKPETYGLTERQIFVAIVLPLLVWCILLPFMAAHSVLPPGQIRHADAVFGLGPQVACPAQSAAACPRADGQAPLTAVVREALRVAKAPSGAAGDPVCGAVGPTASSCIRPKRPDYPRTGDLWPLPLLSLGASFLGYLLAIARVVTRDYAALQRDDGRPIDLKKKHLTVIGQGLVPWLVGSILSSALLWWGLSLARDASLFWLAVAGPLWVGTSDTLRTTVFVALRHKRLRGDLDREWLARLSGTKLAIILAGAAGGLVVVVGGVTLGMLGSGVSKALAGGGIASGGLVAWIGRSAATSFTARTTGAGVPAFQIPLGWIANLAVILFGAVLFALIGHGIAGLIGTAAAGIAARSAPGPITLAWLCLAMAVGCAGLAYILGWAINLNRFSMHAVYRNRLTRAFLGSARADATRHADSFTRFDPADNLRMADAFDRPPAERRLFPVINVALNRTVGDDPARAERKAESFTITPLHCGSPALGKTDDAGEPIGAYVPSDIYAGDEKQTGVLDKHKGISLGTAMTISGAAASPNMGYHSSPLIAAVMTLFNVRLGAWLPNPGVVTGKKTLGRSGPRNAVWALLSDFLGRARLTSPYVYLSDGGHFDNLGIYEMLRRRCGMILAIDAGQDRHYAYEDLTRLIEYARIDLGAEITFLPPIRVGDGKLEAQGAFATIRYRSVDGVSQTGRLIYLKSWLPSDAPVELLAMQKRKIDFPHESTLNQFFTESDFESYRRLGEYLMDCLVRLSRQEGGSPPPPSASPSNALQDLFDGLQRRAQPPQAG